mmetsp:Transcript_27121/g.36231  ORF Transcript_27121/g.36231 Transcript_27121/m.36231 type:complete len:280 (-) Transcript_27121:285-1124(-)
MGSESGGLRMITTTPEHQMLVRELEAEFKAGFMCMSQKDEEALDVHKRTFKEEKKRYTIATYALKTFANNIGEWKPAHSAIQALRDRDRKKRQDDSLDHLVNDLIKVYVLDCLTMTMSCVLTGQGDQAARIHTGAAIACYQFLPKDDPITKQAIKYTERIIDVCKRIPAMSSIKSAFELAIPKMKRPDKLSATDMVQAELPAFMTPAFEDIRAKNEEIPDQELWNTESLCFNYYNILQQYKTTKQDWIEWLRLCRQGPVNESTLLQIERKLQINIAAVK